MDEQNDLTELASNLIQRINLLESRLANSHLLNNDPNVQFRSPGAEFTPTEEMYRRHSYLQEDFFRRPLADSDRRRFLFECPKNSTRQYDPPKINKVQVSATHKHFDATLHQLQYRISGLTRPLDWFTYQLLQNRWDQATLLQQSTNFAHTMHELLSDLASHITQLRTDNMFKGLPSSIEAPTLDSSESYLLDNKEMVEHIKLQQSVQQATQVKSRGNRPRPHRSPFQNGSPAGHNSYNGGTSNTQNSSSFPRGPQQNTNHQPASSQPSSQQQQGFQRRPHQRRPL